MTDKPWIGKRTQELDRAASPIDLAQVFSLPQIPRMKLLQTAFACVAVHALLATSPASAKRAPTILASASSWSMDYRPQSCRLTRKFGMAGEATLFYLEQFAPGDGFITLMAGPVLDRFKAASARFGFGPPGGAATYAAVQEGRLEGFGTAFQSAVVTLDPELTKLFELRRRKERAAIVEAASKRGEEPPPINPVNGPILTPAQERAITWFEVAQSGVDPVRLDLGPMDAPMEAMRKCVDELVTHWGIDASAQRTLTSRPVPTENPAKWLTDDDYPAEAANHEKEGRVFFRLTVDPFGKAISCHIERVAKPQGFDEALCAALIKRARFRPALDVKGKPIASYWRSSARFQLWGRAD